MLCRIRFQLLKKACILRKTFERLCCCSDSDLTKSVILYKVFDILSETFFFVISFVVWIKTMTKLGPISWQTFPVVLCLAIALTRYLTAFLLVYPVLLYNFSDTVACENFNYFSLPLPQLYFLCCLSISMCLVSLSSSSIFVTVPMLKSELPWFFTWGEAGKNINIRSKWS